MKTSFICLFSQESSIIGIWQQAWQGKVRDRAKKYSAPLLAAEKL